MLRITVWNENYHERTDTKTATVHPEGIHGTLAGFLRELPDVRVTCATLDQPEQGLPDELLEQTDVLVWWGHMCHGMVEDAVVDKIQKRVLNGMGLVVLHSGHYSKIFRRLMGTTCDLRWRESSYERLFCVQPNHPIARGLPEHFELGEEECYGERFDIPAPDETIFLGWYDIGEVFRAGCTWYRGYGKVFYFQPGHETFRSFYDPNIQKIIKNACLWAAPDVWRTVPGSPVIGTTLEEKRLKATETAGGDAI